MALGLALTGLHLGLGLRLDVVDGALAATRLFGSELGGDIRSVDVVLRHVFEAPTYAVFYAGLAFGVLACCDFGATDDLLLVAEVHGSRDESLADLGRSLAGALSLGRMQAARQNDELLVALLDESRVIPGRGRFQLELALPLAAIERALGDCARQLP